MSAKFLLGQVVATPGIQYEIAHQPGFYAEVFECINRHIAGDWGEVDAEDALTNDQALIHGTRVLSAYTVCGERIWIITEGDRSVTTVLLPEEY